MFAHELVTIIREDYLRDAAEPYLWSDDSLYRYLAEAERQACRREDLIYDDTLTITLRSGVAAYELDRLITNIDTALIGTSRLQFMNKGELERRVTDWRTVSGLSNAGRNIYAVVRGYTVTLSPIPNDDDAGKLLELEVYRLPEAQTIGDYYSFEIPPEFHRDLIYWALHECYLKQDADTYDPNRAMMYLQRFNEVFGETVNTGIRINGLQEPDAFLVRPYDTRVPSGLIDNETETYLYL